MDIEQYKEKLRDHAVKGEGDVEAPVTGETMVEIAQLTLCAGFKAKNSVPLTEDERLLFFTDINTRINGNDVFDLWELKAFFREKKACPWASKDEKVRCLIVSRQMDIVKDLGVEFGTFKEFQGMVRKDYEMLGSNRRLADERGLKRLAKHESLIHFIRLYNNTQE